MTDTAAIAAEPQPAPVLVHREGSLTRITLNRPRALNALNTEVFLGLARVIAAAQGDCTGVVLIEGAGDRGFSGGGDVKELAGGDLQAGIALLRHEYRLDHDIAVSRVPVVALMDGITMGGGIGLSGHAAMRVVTERSRLAMPEARIGISPDVGGHLLLARAPGRLGELLAITAESMTGADAIALGFADRFVPADRLPRIAERLREGASPAEAVDAVAEAAPEAPLLAAREWFEPIAEAVLGDPAAVFADPAAAATALLRELERSDREEARSTAATVRGMCPTSVAVTLAQLARTRAERLGLGEVLRDDLRILGRLLARPDFAEGVRAQLIDRDGSPRWSPARVEDLDRAQLAAILDPAFAPGETPLDVS